MQYVKDVCTVVQYYCAFTQKTKIYIIVLLPKKNKIYIIVLLPQKKKIYIYIYIIVLLLKKKRKEKDIYYGTTLTVGVWTVAKPESRKNNFGRNHLSKFLFKIYIFNTL